MSDQYGNPPQQPQQPPYGNQPGQPSYGNQPPYGGNQPGQPPYGNQPPFGGQPPYGAGNQPPYGAPGGQPPHGSGPGDGNRRKLIVIGSLVGVLVLALVGIGVAVAASGDDDKDAAGSDKETSAAPSPSESASEPTTAPTESETVEPTPTEEAEGEFSFTYPDKLGTYERDTTDSSNQTEATPGESTRATYINPDSPGDLFLVNGEPTSDVEDYRGVFDENKEVGDVVCGKSINRLCAASFRGGVITINGGDETFASYQAVVDMIETFEAAVE